MQPYELSEADHAYFAQKNVESILAIPAAFITDEMRAEALKRCVTDEGVRQGIYAYRSADVWKFYDVETMILLAPVATLWDISSIETTGNGAFVVTVRRGGEQRHFTLHVNMHPQYDQGVTDYTDPRFVARAGRVIRAALAECSFYGGDPAKLDERYR